MHAEKRKYSKKSVENLTKEQLENKFLKPSEEAPDYIPAMEEEIHIFAEIPKYRDVVFVNQRDPGCILDFHYVSKTHPFKQYHLVPGIKLSLPEEIINHVESLGVPIYGKEVIENGIQIRPKIGFKYNFSFRSAA